MKKYWFAIFPHCFLWLKGKKGLIYNTESYEKIHFQNVGDLEQITKELSVEENLYSIHLTEKDLKDKKNNEWIQAVISKKCGILIEDNGINQRPLFLPPVLKVQDETDYYQWEHQQGIDGNIMENLHHIVFHINGSQYGNEWYARQTLYPIKSLYHLQEDDILHFVKNAHTSPFLSEISLVGNPFILDDIESLIEKLQKIGLVSIYCTQQDANNSLEQINKLKDKVKFHITVTDYAAAINFPKETMQTFVVTSIQEYEAALDYEEKTGNQNIEIIPLYNGNNRSFFEDYFYMDKENIQDITLDKREVFIRQKLNIQNFGRLIVMPDGKVYADPNHNSIGNIHETPHSIVYRELTEGDSWLHIRNEKPCSDCIYQWLCPSPSGYEAVIGKPNLCKIKS